MELETQGFIRTAATVFILCYSTLLFAPGYNGLWLRSRLMNLQHFKSTLATRAECHNTPLEGWKTSTDSITYNTGDSPIYVIVDIDFLMNL